jgi:hypothetical protein
VIATGRGAPGGQRDQDPPRGSPSCARVTERVPVARGPL